ncbi:MAG: hypothetical protein AAF658_12895, partial [Myxococcota bacterium]
MEKFSAPPRGGELVYSEANYGFETDPAPYKTASSLLVNDLQLHLDGSFMVTHVSGVCPHVSWQETSAHPPVATA